MKKVFFIVALMATALATTVSCSPEKITGDEYQDEVDKDKIERPGDQGNN